MNWEPQLSAYYDRMRRITKVNLGAGYAQRHLDAESDQFDDWWLKVRPETSLSSAKQQQLNSFLLSKDYVQLARLIRSTFGAYHIDLTLEAGVQAHTESSLGLSYTILQASEDLQAPKNILIYLHGGGLIGGASQDHNAFLRYVAQELGANWQIISLDYPLVPEHDLVDIITTTKALVTQLVHETLASHVYFVGEGSGGLLSLLIAKDGNDEFMAKFAGQGLINAQINFDVQQYETPMDEFKLVATEYQVLAEEFQQERLYLNLQAMFIEQQGTNLKDSTYDSLQFMQTTKPIPTLILAAEYDVLTPIGITYWHQLQAANWPVEYILYRGVINGFINHFGVIPQAQMAANDLITWLRTLEG